MGFEYQTGGIELPSFKHSNAPKRYKLKITVRTYQTFFIIDSGKHGKQVLWQTVKTLIKCRILRNFIRVCAVSEVKINLQTTDLEKHHFIEILTGNPIKTKKYNSILILSTCMGKSIKMKRVMQTHTPVLHSGRKVFRGFLFSSCDCIGFVWDLNKFYKCSFNKQFVYI